MEPGVNVKDVRVRFGSLLGSSVSSSSADLMVQGMNWSMTIWWSVL